MLQCFIINMGNVEYCGDVKQKKKARKDPGWGRASSDRGLSCPPATCPAPSPQVTICIIRVRIHPTSRIWLFNMPHVNFTCEFVFTTAPVPCALCCQILRAFFCDHTHKIYILIYTRRCRLSPDVSAIESCSSLPAIEPIKNYNPTIILAKYGHGTYKTACQPICSKVQTFL